MLPESLKELAAALDPAGTGAITDGSVEFGESLLWVAADRILDVCRKLKNEQGFVRLSGISAIDRFPAEPRFEVLYLLHSIERNQRLKLKVALASDAAELDSVTGVWEGAGWYERETFDMFGIRFRNNSDLTRILMPEDWIGHPLRKDFPTHGHKYTYQNE